MVNAACEVDDATGGMVNAAVRFQHHDRHIVAEERTRHVNQTLPS